jgi:hypothetical protein
MANADDSAEMEQRVAAGPTRPSDPPEGNDGSAVTVLRELEEERRDSLRDAEYQRMRQAIIEELARGPRCRPFTLVTFAVVILLVCGVLLLGIVTTGQDKWAGLTLALASAGVLMISSILFRSYLHSLAEQARRSLEERLAELEALRGHRLVSPNEYDYIRAAILNSRQRAHRR